MLLQLRFLTSPPSFSGMLNDAYFVTSLLSPAEAGNLKRCTFGDVEETARNLSSAEKVKRTISFLMPGELRRSLYKSLPFEGSNTFTTVPKSDAVASRRPPMLSTRAATSFWWALKVCDAVSSQQRTPTLPVSAPGQHSIQFVLLEEASVQRPLGFGAVSRCLRGLKSSPAYSLMWVSHTTASVDKLRITLFTASLDLSSFPKA
mmetsp:Transcript_34289/g.80150  ORF Transcript_34289/g.80150 Transcript_34289/m.80150 type:complete len:204 (+) Transcript_34289:397-1008(+)